MAKAKKKLATGEALVTAVDSALSVLVNIASNTAKSLIVVDKDNTKYSKEAKRLSKKKAVLMKKKKNAATRVKKSPIADNKKSLKAVEKDIAAVAKDAAKNTALKESTLEELNTLKLVAKRTAAYNKSLSAADKILNKPKPKPKKKKSAKKPAVTAPVLTSVDDQAAA